MKKWVKILFILSILLGGAGLCIVRWNAWFGNQPEPSYLSPKSIDQIVITFGEDATQQRVLTWRAGKKTADSYLVLNSIETNAYDTIIATGEVVASRGGEAAYYKAELDSLEEGKYAYKLFSGEMTSEWQYFSVDNYEESVHFIVFGDIQEKDTASKFYEFMHTDSLNDIDFLAYAGDQIERPIDEYWQIFFKALNGKQGSLPQMAVPGNHEYLKGLQKNLDSRWKYIFSNPQNGPYRFMGSSYYVDFPEVRMIMIDTDCLFWLSDYTITQTWVNRLLQDAGEKWKIIVMHHPVYAAGMFRENPFIFQTFRRTFEQADVVFAGHDHNYARRTEEDGEKLCTPVYIVTTSSSKSYLSKCNSSDQRIASNRAFYEEVIANKDSLSISTNLLSSGEVYDKMVLLRESRIVTIPDSLPEEIVELPDRYKEDHSWKVRRFINRRRSRVGE